MVKRIFPLLTIADIDKMPDDGNRYELIDGVIFMSRAPSLDHQFIVGQLSFQFGTCLAANPVGKAFPGPGIVFDKFNGVIPDFVYVSNERFEQVTDGIRFVSAPDLVVEILSPGRENVERDRFDKRYLYSKFEVREFWIIDAERRQLEIFQLQGSTLELVSTLAGDDEVTSSVLINLRFAARELFVS
jgi:Uma2 family endonuclease